MRGLLKINNKDYENGKANNFRFIFVVIMLSTFTVLPFYNSLIDNSLLYIMKYFVFVLFILILAHKKIKYSINSINFFIILLMIICGLSSLLNIEYSSLNTSILFLIVGIGLAVCTEVFFRNIDQNSFKKMLWTILITLALFVLIPSLVQSLNPTAYYVSTEGRYRFIGVFNNSNELARFMLLGFLISLRILDINKNGWVKLILWLNIILSAYIIFISDSRTSLIIAILGIVVYLFLTMLFKSPKLTLLLLYFILSISLISISVIIFNLFLNLGLTGINELLSGRLDSWTSVLNQGFLNVLFGTGTDREGLAASVVVVNGYIEVIKYLGLIGLLCWILFIYRLLMFKGKYALKSPTKSKSLGISFVILFMAYYLFEGGLVSIGNLASIYFWIEVAQKDV